MFRAHCAMHRRIHSGCVQRTGVASPRTKPRMSQGCDQWSVGRFAVGCRMTYVPIGPLCTSERKVNSGEHLMRAINAPRKLILGIKYSRQAYREVHGTIRNWYPEGALTIAIADPNLLPPPPREKPWTKRPRMSQRSVTGYAKVVIT